MSIDLEKSLAELARSVHDDVTADRMTGQVHHMVSRIRRRRAARHAATGVVGVGAAAAVAFGGLQLTGRDAEPVAPAGPTTSPTASPTGANAFGECGTAVTDVGSGADLAVSVTVDGARDSVTTGEQLRVRATYSPDAMPDGEARVALAADGAPQVVVAREGVVVGLLGTPTGVQDSEPQQHQFSVPLTSCDPADGGAPLEPGEYEVVGAQTFTVVDANRSVHVLSEPWSFTITADEAPSSDAEEVLASILANQNPAPFPACGSEVWLDDGQPPLLLDLELSSGPYAPGGDVTGSATLLTTEGRSILANASAPYLVLAEDGVVVGRTPADPGGPTLVDVAADGSVTLDLEGSLHLCTTDPAALALPAGTYQAYAVVEGALKEVVQPDGTAESVSDPFLAANYIPVDVVVE